MQFWKSCQKTRPIVACSSALGRKLLIKFWFMYHKTVSSFNGRLVTKDAIFTTMPNSFQWRQEVFGWTSEYNYATNYNFKKSSSKCSFCYVGAVFTIIPSCFSELYFCGSTSENKVDFSFWKESFSSVCSSAHEECIFINAAKKLDKNSKALRSISEINYINNQFSQKKTLHEKTFPIT